MSKSEDREIVSQPNAESDARGEGSEHLLSPLSRISALEKGAPAYFATLIGSPDEVVRVGGWCGLTAARRIDETLFEPLLADCRFGAVKACAFEYFESIYEHGLAQRAMDSIGSSVDACQHKVMQARLINDQQSLSEGELASYLATGHAEHLVRAIDSAEAANGWRLALPLAIRSFAATPTNTDIMLRLFTLIEGAKKANLLTDLGNLLKPAGPYRLIAEIAFGLSALLSGDGKSCLVHFSNLDRDAAAARGLAAFQVFVKKRAAEANDMLGNFQRSYSLEVEVNRLDATHQRLDPKQFYAAIETRDRLAIPTLPFVERSDVIQMVGFPRSGTTLLENALAAHDAVETFEEIPAFDAATSLIDRNMKTLRDTSTSRQHLRDIYLDVRARYYTELDHHRTKRGAHVLVDKMPMRSATALFLSRLMPRQRYIFSIRHPYDVVLSCFRQRFTPNPTMANFHTVADAAALYDFTMTRWFDVHSLDDESVCYVRYDQLVANFKFEMSRLFEFLGVEWVDDVANFPVRANERRAKTPSYQKVRQGLGLGLQTNWQNYRFAFQTDATKPLRKWIEFFGFDEEGGQVG